MLDWLLNLPQTSPIAYALAIVSLICALGMAVGSIKFKGIGLGSAAVLFVGAVLGQWIKPVEPSTLVFVRELGLVLFVFTIGLQLGPGFFASLKSDGLKLNVLAAVMVVLAGCLAPLVGWMAGIDLVAVPGLFAGASINIPALGAAQQTLTSVPGITSEQLALPALACAVSYPAAIAGSLATLVAMKVVFHIDPEKEAEVYASERRKRIESLLRRTLVVEQCGVAGQTLNEIYQRVGEGVVVSRIRRAGDSEVRTALHNSVLQPGDTILAIGPERLLNQLECFLGRASTEDLLAAPGKVTYRRIVVTHRDALGRTVEELGLENALGVEVTRVVRGDVEVTAAPGMRLKFGDVLQIVGNEEQLQQAAKLLGNSLKKLNETQFVPLFAGIFLGVLVGSAPLIIPGLSQSVRLGLAGGPLIVALTLGRIGHIGGLVWHMPLNANHAFREFGVALFFAALGLAAGDQFFASVISPNGLVWLATGLTTSLLPMIAIAVWCRVVEKMNFVTLGGTLAGGMTNPPALSLVSNFCRSEAPALAYASVYPLTTLLRLLVAQVLALVFSG